MATNPQFIMMPFAKDGERNDIPVTQPSAGDGRFNQQTGFPGETSIPTINGGKNISRKDMNGLLYTLSDIIFRLQKGTLFNWETSQSYTTPALVNDNNAVYVCIADVEADKVRPSADITNQYWQKLSDYIGESSSIGDRVTAIEGKIPTDASTTNKLADKAFVNSSINALAAYYITKNPSGDPFNTVSELVNAGTYYCGGEVRVPTRNDYAVVLKDENHNNNSTRYAYNNQWEYQYTFNMQFTQAQTDALNSGINATLVSQIGNAQKASKTQFGVVRLGEGVGLDTSGRLQVDVSSLVNAFDWTQLNTSEKLSVDGSVGVIDLEKGRVHITSATTIKMPVPPSNCATWVTLWCTNGKVTFDTSGAPVYFESDLEPTGGTGVCVYTLAGIGTNAWYCLFSGVFPSA